METNLFYYPYLWQSAQEKFLPLLTSIQDEFLQNLFLAIENNIDNSLLCVGFLAMHMAVSKSTLNRRLSVIIGMSPNELIRYYRLRKAALLLASGKNVSETAYLTGFETPSYFTQCFKEYYKITPKKYAQEISFIGVNQKASVA